MYITYLSKECKARKPFFSELGLGSAFFPDLLIQYCVKTFFFLFHWQNIVYEVKYVVVRVKIYWFCQLHFLVRVCWLQKLPTLWWKLPFFCLKLWRRKREKGSFFLAPLKMRRFLSKVCCYHQRWMPWHEYKLCWSCLQTLPSAFTRTNFSRAQNLNFCVAGKNGDDDDTYQI